MTNMLMKNDNLLCKQKVYIVILIPSNYYTFDKTVNSYLENASSKVRNILEAGVRLYVC